MIVPEQVQHTVDDQMRPVVIDRFTLLSRLARHDGRANHDVSERPIRTATPRASRRRKRQHVGRVITSAPQQIKTPTFGSADDANGHFRIAAPGTGCSSGPSGDPHRRRHASTNVTANLDEEF